MLLSLSGCGFVKVPEEKRPLRTASPRVSRLGSQCPRSVCWLISRTFSTRGENRAQGWGFPAPSPRGGGCSRPPRQEQPWRSRSDPPGSAPGGDLRPIGPNGRDSPSTQPYRSHLFSPLSSLNTHAAFPFCSPANPAVPGALREAGLVLGGGRPGRAFVSTRGQKQGAATPPFPAARPAPIASGPRFFRPWNGPEGGGCRPGVCEAALGRELSWGLTWSERVRSDEMQTLRGRQGFVICLKLKVLEVSGLSVIETDVTEKNDV